MYGGRTIAVIIPALDEEEALPGVLSSLPGWIDRVVVVDNGSSDGTSEVARRGLHPGCVAVREERRGYGSACLRGMAAAAGSEVIVFLDADGSDDPAGLPALLDPIVSGGSDLVISNRLTPRLARGALTPAQRFGNWLAVALIRLFWGFRFRDLGPFRAVTAEALRRMAPADPNYGWTVELQVRALECRLSIAQVDVPYRRRRAGRSKVSGTVRGTVGAGVKILGTIWVFVWRRILRSLGWVPQAVGRG